MPSCRHTECSGSHRSSGQSSHSSSSSRPMYASSGRPQLWQCCKCSGGWYNYDINASCPMCHAWRCDNCRYSMS
ncbi:uncharacterized protein TrAtP1_002160 [Trichoderma atroviride]|uniref:Uncharacterized protein n=1 Tax=Hypocrea atroviridis (strain ATCC 20476 / IMI 206040) TaxID=452589 RepID=G9P2S5_HYPAI|nr:uncharacterized protein TRIATDRAFT_310340 [Trichoderma atroviride IMI 206040]EHK42753.1 hypothetical protein TRIATDRAFT_310340 [Trichoderma atroviride IMI 206040]UKZ60891.1 hypothetical protein TrAtP1_002160 [Trichoderma atroviride]